MPAKKTASAHKSAKKTSSKAISKTSASLYEQIESMKELHAFALVILVCLIAGMLLLMMRQKRQIDQLEFQVGFLENQYLIWREKGMRDIEAKIEVSPAPAVRR